MTEQHLNRNINLQPAEGLSFFLFSPTEGQDGITFNDWESMLGVVATSPGNKQILLDPGTAGGTVTIPTRAGEVTSIYDLSDISLCGARPNTFVDVSDVQLDGIELIKNCTLINPTTTIPTFLVPAGTSRSFQFELAGFAQGPVGATAPMFDLDGAASIVSANSIYTAALGGLDLFDVDAAGSLSITSFGYNNFGVAVGGSSIFGGATPAAIQINADDLYFAATQTTPAVVTLLQNLDVSLGATPSVGAWGGPGVPVNNTDAINRIANFVSGIHGPIP